MSTKRKLGLMDNERITMVRYRYLKAQARLLTDMKMTWRAIDGNVNAQIGRMQTPLWSAALRYVRDQAATIVSDESRDEAVAA